jgi:hypothetical protein
METKIKQFCDELSQKSKKKITFECEKTVPNFIGGDDEMYRLYVDGAITKVILSENNITDNEDERNELINMLCKHF